MKVVLYRDESVFSAEAVSFLRELRIPFEDVERELNLDNDQCSDISDSITDNAACFNKSGDYKFPLIFCADFFL